MAATMTYLQLDANFDPIFRPALALTDSSAVAQAVLTRLKLWLGEWWENPSIGLPVRQAMLGQLGTDSNINSMAADVTSRVLGTPYVLTAVADTIDFTNGKLTIKVTYTDSFGITNTVEATQ